MSPITHLLVAGGSGFIGSAFVRAQLRSRPRLLITVLDRLRRSGDEQNLEEVLGDSRLRFVKGDVCDAGTVRRLAADADATVNFATERNGDPSLTVQADVYGTEVLLQAALDFQHRRFLQVSTDEVFGDALSEAELRPRNPYRAGKASADLLVQAYQASFGLPAVISRGCRTFGPYQSPDHLVPGFITSALMGLPLAISGDGSAAARYVYVDDHAAAIDVLLRRGTPGLAYQVGGPVQVSALEIADTVLQLCDRPGFLKHFVPDHSGDGAGHRVMDFGVYQLGWQPCFGFKEAMRLTVDWYRDREDWWMQRRAGVA